ncbi:MAG: ABC transporter ATP-binding protein, partial [Acidobacteriota bacterium]
MSESQSVVEVRGVRKSYRRESFEIEVLKGIDLEIQHGEYVALMGPSGSGKSTLLNLLAGIDQPTGGSLSVAGHNIASLGESDLARWRHRHIGFIFQFYNLLPVLTAFENVELPLTLTRLSKAARKKKVQTALEVVGLADRMTHYPRQLSGGQEQRVAIARAIVTDPTVLLADEP